MPPKKGGKKGKKKRPQQGEGFFGDVWSGIKRGATAVHDFVKDHKVISRGLKIAGTLTAQPELGVAGTAADLGGYGKGSRKAAPKGPVWYG